MLSRQSVVHVGVYYRAASRYVLQHESVGVHQYERIRLVKDGQMKRRLRVYVAGRLSDNAVEYIKNVSRMMEWAEYIRRLGHSVYVPAIDLLMGVKFGVYNYDDYFENSQPWLDVADIVFVCPGAEYSQGTQREIQRAQDRGIKVVYELAGVPEATR